MQLHKMTSSFFSLECVVVDVPVADKEEEDEENTIEIKVQGNDPDSKKTFKSTKVSIEINNSNNSKKNILSSSRIQKKVMFNSLWTGGFCCQVG